MLPMKQTATMISTYTADTMGVASALFELGGMTIMHDASGCNSTYNTHDEPRWYDFDSMVYLSGISEMEAIMGDDEKLIGDIVVAARELSPRFIAIAGTPIPMMTGVDFTAMARVIEKRTGIPTFGFATNGMHSYIQGADMAFEGFVKRFVKKDVPRTRELSVNLLGLTPLDFSVNSAVSSLRRVLEKHQIQVCSSWAMGSTFEELCGAGAAHVNLVVSQCGMKTANYLKKEFGIPYVTGIPMGEAFTQVVVEAIERAARTGEDAIAFADRGQETPEIALIGEGIFACSFAKAFAMETGRPVRVIRAVEGERRFLDPGDVAATDEDEILPALEGMRYVVADPLYRPIVPVSAQLIELPQEGFSGRIYRKEIPDLIGDFPGWVKAHFM